MLLFPAESAADVAAAAMYGILLEPLREAVVDLYGADTWEEVRQEASLNCFQFLTHDTYKEEIFERLVEAVSAVTGTARSDVMEELGGAFVRFVARAGYEDILRVQGRRLRHFIDGIDNIHEYVRKIYPAMQAPSFRCEDESETGFTVHYCSRRAGLATYVVGQLKQVRTGRRMVGDRT